jgi:DNA-binding PadR family transcriptional regulator
MAVRIILTGLMKETLEAIADLNKHGPEHSHVPRIADLVSEKRKDGKLLSAGAIYGMVHRAYGEGLLSCAELPQEGRRNKILWSLTEEGAGLLERTLKFEQMMKGNIAGQTADVE